MEQKAQDIIEEIDKILDDLEMHEKCYLPQIQGQLADFIKGLEIMYKRIENDVPSITMDDIMRDLEENPNSWIV